MSPSQQASQEGGGGKTQTEWGWVRLLPLVGLAATHHSSKEFLLFVMVFNSGLTRHRNEEHCKHLSVFAVISVGNLEMDYAEFLPASFSSPQVFRSSFWW